MAETYTLEIFPRKDGRWAWHVIARNGQIVASDAGQGYENRDDCEQMASRILDFTTITKTEVFTRTPRRAR